MTFEVQSELLREQAKIWRARKSATDSVSTAILPAVGMGDSFGVMAGGNGVSEAFDTWTTAIHDALYDAGVSFDYLDRALVAAAAVYDGDDSTTATSMKQLDASFEPDDYIYPAATK